VLIAVKVSSETNLTDSILFIKTNIIILLLCGILDRLPYRFIRVVAAWSLELNYIIRLTATFF